MFPSRIAPKISRILVGVLLVGFAMVASSDFLGRSSCSGEGAGACGNPSEETRGQTTEGQCDHCISCFVAHGHLLSVVPKAALVAPPLVSTASVSLRHVGTFEPLAAEIFHPPLGINC